MEFVADVETPQPKMKLLLKEFNLKKHKKNVNAIKMRCSVCQVKLYGYKEMNNHMTKEHPDFKVKCNYCACTCANILPGIGITNNMNSTNTFVKDVVNHFNSSVNCLNTKMSISPQRNK